MSRTIQHTNFIADAEEGSCFLEKDFRIIVRRERKVEGSSYMTKLTEVEMRRLHSHTLSLNDDSNRAFSSGLGMPIIAVHPEWQKKRGHSPRKVWWSDWVAGSTFEQIDSEQGTSAVVSWRGSMNAP